MKKNYLGIDTGVGSVGIAVTDENYNLVKAKGKDLWMVRLFQEAETAAECRSHRIARRNLRREQYRIGILRMLFAPEIEKVDPGFFQRLDDSKYHKKDKAIMQPFALFADTGYTDKEYYEDYPTIFHLIKQLLESNKPFDIRLVYLAIHNMFKHRGNFITSSLDDGKIETFSDLYIALREELIDVFGETKFPALQNTKEVENIFSSKAFNNSEKYKMLLNVLNINKKTDKQEVEILKLLCGLKGQIPKIFVDEEFDEENSKLSISFKKDNYDEVSKSLEGLVGYRNFEIFVLCKRIYDNNILAEILKNDNVYYEYLSCARVASYEKHKKDLKILKRVIKNYKPDKYNFLFRDDIENNYNAYINNPNKAGKFFNVLKKIVEEIPKNKDTEYILSEIEKENFLPKQLTSKNGVIPNQIHTKELKKILENAEKYLPFLTEKDESGLTVSEKIINLFESIIPYYVGPLGKEGYGNSWCVKKPNSNDLPNTSWNFDKRVDSRASAEKFIQQLVKNCTYINNETVLPKNSLLYEKFMVLNELNNLKINNKKIDPLLKHKLYNELFKKGNKVTLSTLKKFLKENNVIKNIKDVDISGIDDGFANTLSSYSKFTRILNVNSLSDEQEQMAEQIIFWSTVYGDSKEFLKERIYEVYGEILTEEQIVKIVKCTFKDWGNLSEFFLNLEGKGKKEDKKCSIIERMWNENLNLMELLSNKYTYRDELDKYVVNLEKTLMDIQYEDLDELYASAPVKRMIWQTIVVLKDLYSVYDKAPDKIFIEMARENNTKKERTVSRKDKLKSLYKKNEKINKKWIDEIDKIDSSDFKRKKLYLYYMQKGRCMYSGEEINFSDLFNKELYDIDHIHPKCLVVDDSIEDNLVLVKKTINQNVKRDYYPLEKSIRDKQCSWWKQLKEEGFITKEKYERLIRDTELTDEEKAAFICRQLVETRQGTKILASLLKNTFPKSEIVYVKAENVTDFRKKFDIVKCREVNDYHHAHDAYLNIVVGNTYDTKFTKNPINFIKKNKKDKKKYPYHMHKIFDYTVERDGVVAWNVENNESLNTVINTIKKSRPLITKMNFENKGKLFDINIVKASKVKKANGVGYLPIKSSNSNMSDTCKYGGYCNYRGAYFFLVEHTYKNERIRTLEQVPLYCKSELDTVEKFEKYCVNTLGYSDPSVRMKKIKMYSLIKVDGFYLYLTGRSGDSIIVTNAIQMCLRDEYLKYVKKISSMYNKDLKDADVIKYNQRVEANSNNGVLITKEKNIELYDVLMNKHLFTIYNKRPNPVGEKLKEWRSSFENIGITEQMYTLIQILKLSQLVNSGADLKLIGGSANTGTTRFNKRITDKQEFILINQSASGLYSNEIDLQTV